MDRETQIWACHQSELVVDANDHQVTTGVLAERMDRLRETLGGAAVQMDRVNCGLLQGTWDGDLVCKDQANHVRLQVKEDGLHHLHGQMMALEVEIA